MHQISIVKGRQVHWLAPRRRSTGINLLLWRTTNGFHTVAPDWILSKLFLIIGNPCVESNSTVQTFLHMPNYTLQLFQKSFMWCHTERTKRHYSMSNVKLAHCDQPLSRTNQCLEMFDAIRPMQKGVSSNSSLSSLSKGACTSSGCSPNNCLQASTRCVTQV